MYNSWEEEIWELVSLILTGEADESVLQKLEELINTDQACAYNFRVLQYWWKAGAVQDAPAPDHFFESLLKRLPAAK